jgi:hypothetical protein
VADVGDHRGSATRWRHWTRSQRSEGSSYGRPLQEGLRDEGSGGLA